MEWTELIGTVGKVAPLLGSAFGPIGTGVGMAINGIASIFGADPKDPDDIFKKMTADPEWEFKLKQLEAQTRTELLKIVANREAAEYADRASARAREVSIVQAIGKQDWRMTWLGSIVVFGLFGSLIMVVYGNVPVTADPTIQIVINALRDGFIWIIGYYFGSSKGSNDKTQLLANKKPDAPF